MKCRGHITYVTQLILFFKQTGTPACYCSAMQVKGDNSLWLKKAEIKLHMLESQKINSNKYGDFDCIPLSELCMLL